MRGRRGIIPQTTLDPLLASSPLTNTKSIIEAGRVRRVGPLINIYSEEINLVIKEHMGRQLTTV